MAKVRIHLAPMPELLRQMITDLLAPEDDIEIVGRGDATSHSLAAARATGANMIIAQEETAAEEGCLGAVVDDLPLAILTIGSGGSTGTSINFSRQEVRLGGEGAASLAEAVRKAAALA